MSVVIPTLVCDEKFEFAFNSLRGQTSENNEILVVVDNSIACNRVSHGVRPLINFVNLGAYGARNQGLKHATGDFITVHDADDWSHPQKLEMQVKALLDNPKAMASVSHWARCTTDMQFETRPDGSVVHRNISSLMIRREVFERLGYWDRVSVNADTEYYYRILAAYGPDSIVEVMPGRPLALGRRHEGSLTMQPETHWKTQFGGVRKDYMDAAHKWHKECAKTGNWYMPFAPKERPFPVPELIDRAVIELGEKVWPHIRAKQAPKDGSPCILLCGHAAAEQQFGAERSLLDLAKAIDACGYRLVLTLPERQNHYIEQLKPYCSDIVLLPAPWREDDEVWDIAVDAYQRLINHFNIDLIHVNTVVHRTPLLAAKRQGTKSVLHVRELLSSDSALQAAMGQSNQTSTEPTDMADLVLANSHYTAEQLAHRRDAKNGDRLDTQIRVLTNTVELSKAWQPKAFSLGDPIRVGMISSNLPKKGIADFIRVAQGALDASLALQFYLIGPRNEHIDSLSHGLPSNVALIDYSPGPDAALAHIDLLLNLSLFQETFGRTVAEAMLAAKPVITYRWGALPELVNNGCNGFLVHLGDVEGVVSRLAYLCDHPDQIYQFGQEGQAMAQTRFTPKRFRDELAQVYQSLLGVSTPVTH
ncbi:glycosyl transferase family 2 [Ferrimonas balearica DSM 9799]|uniref:Glycosyl transferase family 2 n=1 Tax=Ferrimonas balearica (strain DSM 9799 / CCM 4581 / KCTC 23876 / PAT) TaxID=550540 RepID=E1SP09_FERBD|nr:glycosyl transferase family 2 [Ferrimonas balearica DSM 9799]